MSEKLQSLAIDSISKIMASTNIKLGIDALSLSIVIGSLTEYKEKHPKLANSIEKIAMRLQDILTQNVQSAITVAMEAMNKEENKNEG